MPRLRRRLRGGERQCILHGGGYPAGSDLDARLGQRPIERLVVDTHLDAALELVNAIRSESISVAERWEHTGVLRGGRE